MPSRADLTCHASLRRSRERRALTARRRRLRRGTRSLGLAVVAALSVAAGGAAAQEIAPALTGGTAARSLAPGSGGSGVVALQRKLGVTADGVYGPRTRRAVRAFQRRRGLPVTGVAGPATLRALGLRARTATRSTSSGAGGATAQLERIARCESGGNPAAVSADGRYRGKYQFSRATWRALGGTGDPAAAPEAEQDRLAAVLLARAGTSPWPNCA